MTAESIKSAFRYLYQNAIYLTDPELREDQFLYDHEYGTVTKEAALVGYSVQRLMEKYFESCPQFDYDGELEKVKSSRDVWPVLKQNLQSLKSSDLARSLIRERKLPDSTYRDQTLEWLVYAGRFSARCIQKLDMPWQVFEAVHENFMNFLKDEGVFDAMEKDGVEESFGKLGEHADLILGDFCLFDF